MHVRVGEAGDHDPAAEVEHLRGGERRLVDADAARDLVARDRERALGRHLGIERADEAVRENHVFAESTRVRLVETPTTIGPMPLDPLTDEQREIRELVRTIARERIAPRAAEIDKSGEFPWDIVEVFRENDLFGIMFDEEYGGIGESSLMTFVTVEELSKVCATSGLIIAVQELGSLGIKLAGTDGAEAALPAEARERRVAGRLRADRARARGRTARRCARPRGSTATSTC